MKYTWQVIQECLRIQPAVETGFQECVKEFEYEGFTIPKGWRLFWHLGRSRISPQLFPNPERFDPDWFEGLGPPPPFTYMPFGGGPQICLGMEFARTKMVVFCTTWCSIMNGRWSIPMRELFGIHFQCSKKDFHSKLVRNSPWNFTVGDLIKNGKEGHVKLNVN